MTVLSMDGIADPRLFMIGAGILEINRKNPVTGIFDGYRDMGEVSVVTPSSADERFKKKSSRDRYRATIANLLLSRDPAIDVQIDDWSKTALGLFFQGTTSAQSAQVGTAVTGEVLTTAAWLGSTYLTAKRGPITGVVVHNTTTSATLTVGTDYVVSDPNVGKIRILDDAPGVTAGDDLTIDYTPTAYSAGPGAQIVIGDVSVVEAAVRFISDPVNGPRLLFDWPLAEIVPNGGLPLINTGNTNTPIPLTINVKSDTVGHPSYPIGRILQLPA